nr:hypothetical protein [Candidatus Sigynarchaeota archaeon]
MADILDKRDFVNIGAAISKYTSPMDGKLEEEAIGITVSDDQGLDEKSPKIQPLETTPVSPVDGRDKIDLRYFQDGIQRTLFIGNVFSDAIQRLVPVLFSTVGSIVVCVNDQGNVRQYTEPVVREKFVVPKISYLPKEIVDAIPAEFIEELPATSKIIQPNDFRKMAFNHFIRPEREKVEKKTIEDFEIANPDDWLVIDGYIQKAKPHDKKVGIIKRHGRWWLDEGTMYQVLKEFSCNHGQRLRSCKFRITYKDAFRAETVSCYTKLLYDFKPGLVNNPEFSVIRVEVPFQHEHKLEAILTRILDMNSPMSNPVDSWDKKIYPILVAEKLLKARAKDQKLVLAAFGKVI